MANNGTPTWKEVRSGTGRLLFKFNPAKNIIEHKSGQKVYLVDLDDQTVSVRPPKIAKEPKLFGSTGLLNWPP